MLPKKWCQCFDAAVARFWWGQRNGERKIHWKNWESPIAAKAAGGLGFRDIVLFNLALLAELVGEFITIPISCGFAF